MAWPGAGSFRLGTFPFHAGRYAAWLIRLLFFGLLTGCGTTGFLAESESKLGVGRSATLGTALSAYHTTLLEPAGLAMRFPGYVLGVEKIQTDTGRERTVTHIVRYPTPGSGAGGHFPRPCVLMSKIQPTPSEKARLAALDDPRDWGLYDVCDDWSDAVSSTATMRQALERDLRAGDYTHVFLIVMGWNTQQEKAIRNYNAILTNLVVEADRPPIKGQRFKPLVIGVSWPSQWDLDSEWSIIPAALVRGASFFTKKEQAEEIGKNILVPLIDEVILPARAGAGRTDTTSVVMIGHSFGARAMVASLQAPDQSSREPRVDFQDRDRLVLLQGAVQFHEMFEPEGTGPVRPLAPRLRNSPLRVVMSASAYDSAVSTAIWGWYLGDEQTFQAVCGGSGKAEPIPAYFRDLDLSAFGCQHAVRPGAWGLNLCQEAPPPADPPALARPMDGARIRYWNASWMINCPSHLSGGGAHSDIYRREFARFLLREIGFQDRTP